MTTASEPEIPVGAWFFSWALLWHEFLEALLLLILFIFLEKILKPVATEPVENGEKPETHWGATDLFPQACGEKVEKTWLSRPVSHVIPKITRYSTGFPQENHSFSADTLPTGSLPAETFGLTGGGYSSILKESSGGAP